MLHPFKDWSKYILAGLSKFFLEKYHLKMLLVLQKVLATKLQKILFLWGSLSFAPLSSVFKPVSTLKNDFKMLCSLYYHMPSPKLEKIYFQVHIHIFIPCEIIN